jgi:hypothetical protein
MASQAFSSLASNFGFTLGSGEIRAALPAKVEFPNQRKSQSPRKLTTALQNKWITPCSANPTDIVQQVRIFQNIHEEKFL